jgi:hypothetical protein
VRFAVAVLGAGTVQVFPYLRLDQWVGTGAALALAYIAFAAFGAGFFAGRRAWLAGALSVFVGALLYAVVQALRPYPGGGPDLGSFTSFVVGLPIAVFPFAIIGALAGAAGGLLRGRAVPIAR